MPTMPMISLTARLPRSRGLPKSRGLPSRGGQQEVAVGLQEFLPLLPLRPVARVADDLQAGIGQPVQQQLRLVQAPSRVVVGPQQQRRHADLADPVRAPREVLAHLGVLQHQRVRDRAQETRAAVDGATQGDQLVGDHLGVVEQELDPAAHGRVARVTDRSERAVPQPGHHLGLVRDVARGVEYHPGDAVGVVGGGPRGDPAAQRLAGQVRRGDVQRVHQAGQVVAEHVDGVRPVRQVRPAVADHVVGSDAEVQRQARDVAGVGLQVAAGAMQEHEVGTGSRAQHPRAHSMHVNMAQLMVGVGQLAPDADVLGQVAHDWSSGKSLTCGPPGNGRAPRRQCSGRRSAAG